MIIPNDHRVVEVNIKFKMAIPLRHIHTSVRNEEYLDHPISSEIRAIIKEELIVDGDFSNFDIFITPTK